MKNECWYSMGNNLFSRAFNYCNCTYVDVGKCILIAHHPVIICADTSEDAITIVTAKLPKDIGIGGITAKATRAEEIDPIVYWIENLEKLEKKTEHVGDIYGLIICLIIFIVIINIIALFVKV